MKILKSLMLIAMVITFNSCQNIYSKMSQNIKTFSKIQEIISTNYFSFKSIEQHPYNREIVLYPNEFRNKCLFLNSGDYNFINTAFDKKIISTINIYNENTYSFLIADKTFFPNTTFYCAFYTNNVDDIKQYYANVKRINNIEGKWYYVEYIRSLAD